ncbi:MAG: MoxR family ATPase [Bacteroidetes Order II. Incertae sedis bacterium]|nr:MoxR family ATPase [Bacteroidetes Order II. bacterium]
MTPADLQQFLHNLIDQDLHLSVMIWGAPGIGKSSIVAQVAEVHQLPLIDVRLSQLAPTDLRGLPVAENGVSRWYPPEFLPRDGAGILFLDELNLAPPIMQGMAQQLILDRKVGSYEVPEDWFIWAAGNRKEDRAAIFDMPTPLANRFLHIEVRVDFESFKRFAFSGGIHEQVLAFLAFRTELLHKMDTVRPAWPSPRSWEMASRLHQAGLSVIPAVGEAAGAEFTAFVRLYETLPDIDAIIRGNGQEWVFPTEASARYATVIGLVVRAKNAEQGYHAFSWLAEQAGAEWLQLFATDLIRAFRQRELLGELAQLVQKDVRLQQAMRAYIGLVGR